MTVIATRCHCGAITVEAEDGSFSNSMRLDTFRKEFPGVRIRSKPKYGDCNYCVNQWGVDLCGCGSGAPVGKCRGKFQECRNKTPAQKLRKQKETVFRL